MTYDIDALIDAVSRKAMDRDLALHQVTFTAAIELVKKMTDDGLAQASGRPATTDKQRGMIDAVRIELAYRTTAQS